MARRFDQYYRVKPRDNLGDPDYWNRRFDDIDRRVSSNEDGLDEIGGLTAYVEGLALDRLDLVLAPALDKITLVSEQGFLLAHSNSSVTLDVNTTQTFAIPDEAERELFAPSPFVTIVRGSNTTDYAFARLVSWDKASGQLVLQPLQVFGNPGPFIDWVIYVGTAISQAVEQALIDTQAARDLALQAKSNAADSAAQTATDLAAVQTLRNDALAFRNAAQGYAATAQSFDPSSYYQKTDIDAKFTNLLNGASPALDTLQELAAAINNDANYAATVTAALGNRLRVDTATQGLNSTQQSNARLNLGINQQTWMAASTDLNNLRSTGYYLADGSIANAPVAGNYWYIESLVYTDSSYVMQRVTGLSGSVQGSVYFRISAGGTWGAWRLVMQDTGNQNITGGFSVTPVSLGTGAGTVSLNPLLGNYQFIYNSGSFTIAVPSVDCAIDLFIFNTATAGSITFSGFYVSTTGTGDALNTVNGQYFCVSIRRVGGVPFYTIKRIN